MRYHGLVPFIAAIPSALAVSPQRPEFTNTTTLPTHFAMMLIPEFQALDVIGPLDVLNTLSMYYKNVTKMHLSVISRSMDPVASTNRTGKGYFGQDILPTTTFQDVLKGGGSCPAAVSENGSGEAPGTANSQGGGYGQGTTEKPQEAPPTGEGSGKGPEGGYGKGYGKREDRTRPAPADEAPLGDIEVLLVPGGGGTRRDMTEEIAFVKTMYPKLKYIISVCTGSTILARAGILDGKQATTNKRAWAWAVTTGPNVEWVPAARWVEDGNIWSSSGISAGIDVTFAWVSKIYGEEAANWIAASMEYERWTDAHRDPFAQIWDVPGAGGAAPALPAAPGAPGAPDAAPAPPTAGAS